MNPASPTPWSALAAAARKAGALLPPLPAFAEALTGARDRQFAELGYTFWNGDLLDRLVARLEEIAASCPSNPSEFRWVELAAGTGRWSAELARRGLRVAATDSYAQAKPAGQQRTLDYGSWVGRYTAREATAQLRPHGVLCAWPPLGSGLVLDLLHNAFAGSESLRSVVCIGEPSGATEAPEHPELLPSGWEIRRWPECDRYLVGFNDPPAGPGWRTHSQLLVYVRTQQSPHTGKSAGPAENNG